MQVANSMTRPQLTICPHTHMDILKTGELLHYFNHGTPDNMSDEFDINKRRKITTSLRVMNSLALLYNTLEYFQDQESYNVSKKSKLANWRTVKDDLISENELVLLADNWNYLRKSYLWMHPLYCKKGVALCTVNTVKHDILATGKYSELVAL